MLNPPQSDYLYFVASGKGEHHFSTTIAEHNEYVAKYRSFMAAKALPSQAPAAPAAQ